MKTILTIGGCADGQRQEDPPCDIIQCRSVRPRIQEYDPLAPMSHRVTDYGVGTYRRETIQCESRKFSVFVWEGMTMDEAMARLIKDYPPPDAGDDSLCNVRRLRAEIRRLESLVTK